MKSVKCGKCKQAPQSSITPKIHKIVFWVKQRSRCLHALPQNTIYLIYAPETCFARLRQHCPVRKLRGRPVATLPLAGKRLLLWI